MYLIDTNVLIEHLRKHKLIEESLADLIVFRDRFYISTLTEMEIMTGKSTRQSHILKIVIELLDTFQKLMPDSITARLAGQFRRDHGLAAVDAILAATARLQNFTLITKNIKDFKKIPGLKVKSPQ